MSGQGPVRAQDLERELEQQLALARDVGIALTNPAALDEQLTACTAALVRHLDVALARIWTLRTGDDTLILRASSGLYTHLDGGHSRVRVGTFKIGRIAAEREPHITNNVLDDPRLSDREWARKEGMIAFAGYPLVVGIRLVGVMGMFARHELSISALDALAGIARQVSLRIDGEWAARERDAGRAYRATSPGTEGSTR